VKEILVHAKVLWIESEPPSEIFIPALRKKGFEVEVVPTGKAALGKIREIHPQVVVVNAASLRSNGARICQNLRAASNGLPIVFIANPTHPVEGLETGANVVMELPFTVRKLVNRIHPMLPRTGTETLARGPIILNLEHNIVECHENETKLTPRLTHLLRMFLETPGIVLERERLFKEVWNTDYTGDTRTLDVHISWLRRAIEVDPRNPTLLKTMRGVGYRLDIA
jgi:DNA-binding response OmpR family regulator